MAYACVLHSAAAGKRRKPALLKPPLPSQATGQGRRPSRTPSRIGQSFALSVTGRAAWGIGNRSRVTSYASDAGPCGHGRASESCQQARGTRAAESLLCLRRARTVVYLSALCKKTVDQGNHNLCIRRGRVGVSGLALHAIPGAQFASSQPMQRESGRAGMVEFVGKLTFYPHSDVYL